MCSTQAFWNSLQGVNGANGDVLAGGKPSRARRCKPNSRRTSRWCHWPNRGPPGQGVMPLAAKCTRGWGMGRGCPSLRTTVGSRPWGDSGHLTAGKGRLPCGLRGPALSSQMPESVVSLGISGCVQNFLRLAVTVPDTPVLGDILSGVWWFSAGIKWRPSSCPAAAHASLWSLCGMPMDVLNFIGRRIRLNLLWNAV